MVTRVRGLVLLLWLFGGVPAGASERLAVEVLSALGEPLLATLALPSDAPTAPLNLELQGAPASPVAQSDPARPRRVFLRSESALHAPIVQGVLQVGQGAKAQGYPLTLFLDQRTAPKVLARAEHRLPSSEAVLKGPGLASKSRLEVRPPAPRAAPMVPSPLQAEHEKERAALAAALARAEAGHAAQAAQLAALRAQLARQQRALEAMQQASVPSPPLESPWGGRQGVLVGAALAGLAGLAGLGGLLLRRREAPVEPVAPSTAADAIPEARPNSGPGLRPYEPSAIVQRFGAQSLLSQRDWSAVLDQAEMALAYGRLDEAEATLSAALEEDPHSVALRLQSLALAVEQGDRSRFDLEAASLARGADAALAAKLRELAERLPPLTLGPEAPTLDASIALETPGSGRGSLALEAAWNVELAEEGDRVPPPLGTGLAFAPEGEGLGSGSLPPQDGHRG